MYGIWSADMNQDDEGIDEFEEDLGDDADDDQGSYQGVDEGRKICLVSFGIYWIANRCPNR